MLILAGFCNTEFITTRNRYLSRGGGALLIGPTGIGKSTLLMQWLILWALGQPTFGITPTGALRILLVQAENDDGDLAEMRDGVVAGLGLTDDDRVLYNANLQVATENSRSGLLFVEVLDQILEANPVDLVVLDPLFAYLGCDATEQAGVTTFLRNGLNPLLERHRCGVCSFTIPTSQVPARIDPASKRATMLISAQVRPSSPTGPGRSSSSNPSAIPTCSNCGSGNAVLASVGKRRMGSRPATAHKSPTR